MSIKWRVIIAVAVLLGVFVKIAPNFVNLEDLPWPTKKKVVYGLDIQGGVHLVMGVDIESVMKEKLQRMVTSLNDDFKSKGIEVKDVAITDPSNHEVKVSLANPGDEAKAKDVLETSYGQTLQILTSQGGELTTRFLDARILEYRKQVLDQAIEVIRNRIDEFGVAEPSISAQGDSRILIQLPGIKDSAKAKDLINRTARLEFRMVTDEIKPADLAKMITEVETAGGYALGKDGLTYGAYVKKINEDLKKQLPEKTMVAFGKMDNAATMEIGKQAYLLRTDTELGGDQLDDASVSFDEVGKPIVSFRFDPDGRRKFAEITGANIGKQMAIVLDEIVQSAPVIQGRIDSDSAQITLNQRDYQAAMDEAKMIATTLRAGALPAKLEQLEERTVGPTLGADAIAKAKVAGFVAFGLIMVFMVGYYGFLGVIATGALALNVACLIAVLSGLGATLTLPGIAGIILTMGMAVDSNVIIFERIKEEFAKGITLKGAVRDGFDNAYSAIIDSNIMGAAVALILFYYGTGPVRGFAVTLVSGIATSMFTAVFLSRLLIELTGERIGLKRAGV